MPEPFSLRAFSLFSASLKCFNSLFFYAILDARPRHTFAGIALVPVGAVLTLGKFGQPGPYV
ncbi:hypothetical protein AB4144_41045, partial [Rhizobiaceae sp. 2RAB30]